MEKKIGGLVMFITILGMGMLCGCIGDTSSSVVKDVEIDMDWVENNTGQWIAGTNLIDELSLCENYNEYCQVWYNDYKVKGNNIWVIAGITVKQDYSFKSTQFVLYSIDAGDNWRILWRGDENERVGDNYGLEAIRIIDEDKMTIRLSGIMSSSNLCTYDGGSTWRVDNK
jgi:hypothetical protein